METIDFLFFEKANFPTIEPLLERLSRHSRIRPRFVKGFDYKEFTGFVSPPRVSEAIEQLDIFDFAKIPSFDPNEILRGWRSLALPDWPHPQGLKPLLEAPYWSDILPRQQCVAEALDVFVDRYRPRLVIIPEDVHYIQGRLAARVLKSRGIKVWALLPPFYQIMRFFPLVGERYADRYLVMNEAVRQSYLQAGVISSDISIVGNPYFVGAALGDKKRVSRQKKQVWFACQGPEWDEVALSDFISTARRFPDHGFHVKTHPSLQGFPAVDPNWPRNVSLVEQGRIDDCLGEIDCLIGVSSTSLYRAGLAGVPAIALNYEGAFSKFRVPAGQTCLQVAEGPQSLAKLLKSALQRPSLENANLLCSSPEAGIDRMLSMFERELGNESVV